MKCKLGKVRLMKMSSKISGIILIGLLAAAIFSSCVETIDMDIQKPDPKIVINCGITADSMIVANVTRSMYRFDSLYYVGAASSLLREAIVSVYVNGEYRGNMQTRQIPEIPVTDNVNVKTSVFSTFPTHISTISVSQGDMVELRAVCPRYKDVSAKTFIPHATPIISIDTVSFISKWETGSIYYGTYTTWEIQNIRSFIKFKDANAGKKDYYALAIDYEYTILGIDSLAGNIYSHQINYNYDQDPALSGGIKSQASSLFSTKYYSGYIQAFSDDLFDGKDYTINVDFIAGNDSFYVGTGQYINDTVYYAGDNYYVWPIEIRNTYPIQGRYIFKLLTLSENYYYYLKSREYLSEQDDWDLTEIGLAEPVRIYTNVKGGIGLVGGYQAFEKILPAK